MPKIEYKTLYKGLTAKTLALGGADCFLRAIYKIQHPYTEMSLDVYGYKWDDISFPKDYIQSITKIWKNMGRRESLYNPDTVVQFKFAPHNGYLYEMCELERDRIHFNWHHIANYIDTEAQKNGWTKVSKNFKLPISWLNKKITVIYLGNGAEGPHTHYWIERSLVDLFRIIENDGFTDAYYKILD